MTRSSTAILLSTLLLGGCSGASRDDSGGETAGEHPSGAAGVGGGSSTGPGAGGFAPAGSGGGAPVDDCAPGTELVYVIDEDHSLYRFDPKVDTPAAFALIGTADCPSGSPNSMAVGRDGFAYVLFGSDDSDFQCTGVYKVDLGDASCVGPTAFQCGASGFEEFGMGFSTNGPNSSEETLFLAESSLGRIDLASGQVTPVGQLPTDTGELSGNAKSELWGFLPSTSPPTVIQIDKTSGAALKTFPLDLDNDPDDWAFAFWGGSFYIFYQSGSDSSTNVYKLSEDGQMALYIGNTGLHIVGAGVSTCAPVIPPPS